MTTTLMATTSTPTSFYSSSSSTRPKPTLHCSLSPSLISRPKAPNFRPSKSIPVLGISNFSPWNGLSHLGISGKPPSYLKLVGKGRSRRRGAAYASLFGVGAPEALVIGVVALLVFGPKGLAEVARNLGKTLRAFQPTIRELQDVSREFKSTLEREIGLDDINPSQNMYSSNRTNVTPTQTIIKTEDSQTMVDPNGASPPKEAYTSEEYLKITEEQLKAVATQQLAEAPETMSVEQPQDGALKEVYAAKEYLKVTEERLKVVEQPQSPPQAQEVQETAAAMPPSQEPESSP